MYMCIYIYIKTYTYNERESEIQGSQLEIPQSLEMMNHLWETLVSQALVSETTKKILMKDIHTYTL